MDWSPFYIEWVLWKSWILERNSWYRFSDEQNSRVDNKQGFS